MSYAPTQRPVTARASTSSDMSNLHVPPQLHRHRKTVSTGGGRAWSEAEEAYLIETRERKMPYKHIAAQLKKTELACRLHYHQLSFGNKSRRTAYSASVHSMDRSSMTPPTMRQPTPQRPLPSFSPPASPENRDYTLHNPIDNSLHKPILPKPIVSPERAGQDSRALRLVTDDIKDRHYVDIPRLDKVYDSHRLHFWSRIASEYGGNLSPATLEEAWRRAHGISGSNFPPTPRGSPQSSQAQPSILTTPFSAVTDPGNGFRAVNQRRESSQPPPRSSYPPPSAVSKQSSFAISSLLTDNKEVRSPSRERKLEELQPVEPNVHSASSASPLTEIPATA
ncbi:uncharacterized protein KY384_001386 [Bacidia gigantensis]|uniref:uncharacterized protein n=1 Tax=Bacidia gigantensis TaxID=2732470 RepID=UPI001D053E5B|nr:uncharacterized protein KY384_001386 [Bacidia gigantensis]KAG8533645.1 hypothetical protein KY384_001386 [Bacidia gigantensis]